MKRFLTILILSFITLFANAQIYTSVKYLDKFDDVVKEQTIKTIVQKTDSTFIVETKGKELVEYIIVMNNFFNSAGSEDETVNLFDNIYGYQESWIVMTRDEHNKWLDSYEKWKDSNLNDEYLPQTSQFVLTIVHRVIKTQYTHEYKSELFWIQDDNHTHLGKDIDRIIYIKN